MDHEFWGITAFFNPQRYRRRKQQFDVFRESAKKQGLHLLAVELAFEGAHFELQKGDAEILIQLRAGSNGILWQKERLLNLGLNRLPPECELFAWLDCDVIFENPRWIPETVELLGRYAVVQPFSISVRLPRGKTSTNIQSANQTIYDRKPSAGYAYRYAQAFTDYMRTGHTGFAWAARRSLFEGLGFYDKMIAGGGDTILACGFFGRPTHRFTHLLPEALVEDQRQWIETMSERVRSSVSFTRGGLLHLWHGSQPSRRTLSRLKLLTEYSFDPREDIERSSEGYFVWSGNQPVLQKKIAHYFWLRNEDDNLIRENIRRLAGGLRESRWQARFQMGLTRAATSLEAAASSRLRTSAQTKATLVLLNWKRPEMVRKVIAAYSRYPVIGDIVVWNNNAECSPELNGDARVKSVTCKFDAGLDSRWAAGVLAENEHLLIHDDDVLISEASLKLLFRRYLRNPDLIHGIRGRDCTNGYNRTDSLGRVDVVLTTCLMIHRKYINEYFRHVPAFDDLRDYGCGNGEDIVMSYVVRKATGEKGRAHGVPFADFDKHLAEHSVSRRPGHMAVRNEITRRCIERLIGEKASFKIEDYGLDELARVFPASWIRYIHNTDTVLEPGNFALSENISAEKFADALSLLCRRRIHAHELALVRSAAR
ncbi:MAG TPA: hypothetical protein VG322_03230 [Candidatus Acidoferrales bacterium]|nr:hypothetical protein [Candidatus Acidoferrales bacterium]